MVFGDFAETARNLVGTDPLLRQALGALHAKLVPAHAHDSGVEAWKVTDFTLQQSMSTRRGVGSSSA